MVQAGILACISNFTINYCILDILDEEVFFDETFKPQLRDVNLGASAVENSVDFFCSSRNGLVGVEAPGVRVGLEVAESDSTTVYRPKHIFVGLKLGWDTVTLSDIRIAIVNPRDELSSESG